MSLKWLIVIFCLICSNSLAQTNLTKSATNELRKIDSTLSKVHYEHKTYSYKNKPTVKQIETKSQPPDVTLGRGYGNCSDIAVLTKKLAEDKGMKAEYIQEKNHVAVRVETKNGAAFRYSNGKNTGRTW